MIKHEHALPLKLGLNRAGDGTEIGQKEREKIQEMRKQVLADAFIQLPPYDHVNIDLTRLPDVIGQYIAYLAVGSCADSAAFITRNIKLWIPFVISPRDNLAPIMVLLYNIQSMRQKYTNGLLCAILDRRGAFNLHPSVFSSAEDDFVDFTEKVTTVTLYGISQCVDGSHRFPWPQCRDQLFPLRINECVARVVESHSSSFPSDDDETKHRLRSSRVQWMISLQSLRQLAAAVTPLTVENHEFQSHMSRSMLRCYDSNGAASFNAKWREKHQKNPLKNTFMYIGAAVFFSGIVVGLACKYVRSFPRFTETMQNQSWMNPKAPLRIKPIQTVAAMVGITMNLLPLLTVVSRESQRYWDSDVFNPAWHARPQHQQRQNRALTSLKIAVIHSLGATAFFFCMATLVMILS